MPRPLATLRERAASGLRAASAWLQDVPLADPMDRRNAATLQVLFLFLGTTVPLNWWRHVLAGMITPQLRVYMFADVAAALFCFASFWLIRRGRLRGGIALFVTAQLSAACAGYAATAVMFDQTVQMLSLLIAGLVLGRRALWTVFAMLLAVVAIGVLANLLPATRTEQALTRAAVILPSFVMSYLVVTLVLDRIIAAMRGALAESKARGERLEREMRERERAQAQLVEAQKLEATGRLASGVAHDFDNILALMAGFSGERHRVDPAAGGSARAEALAEALEGVEQAAQRGMTLTRKLLSFAQPLPARPETFDAGQALAELAPMLRQSFGPDVRVRVGRADTALPIRIDRHQFDLMLLNIASNARDAMPDGGAFEAAAARAADGRVEIVLRDSGHGMPAHVRERAFEPFFTTKPPGSGTGLGLAVAHGLVTGADGSIEVESAPGAGTAFRILLPFAAADAAPAGAQPSEVST
ncbi:histidine kinase [Luteimonas sp. Y-2-2-4F]|nr:ATP-binding protein [Luteimonas sp. Y-2-2-4F]MCD9033491.1 histidine kinase [Luteimonas sp. Y-2-2-4F]